MKTMLLIIALLSIPALSSASDPLQSETWTTVCENGVEKVRSVFVLRLQAPLFDEEHQGGGELSAGASCAPCGDGPNHGTTVPLGNDLYAYLFTWSRDCFAGEAIRSGRLFYTVMLDGWPENRWVELQCTAGPQPIIDNIECSPLPVAQATWGAVKALYFTIGGHQ